MSTVAVGLGLLPKNYGYVALTVASTFYLHIYQILTVSKWRGKSGIKYPQLYAEKAEMEADANAKIFNCAQRAHGNTLEILPQMIFGILFSGLAHPIAAASLGATWVVGRFCYTFGYSTGTPSNRYAYGGQLHNVGAIGILGLTTWTAVSMVIASF